MPKTERPSDWVRHLIVVCGASIALGSLLSWSAWKGAGEGQTFAFGIESWWGQMTLVGALIVGAALVGPRRTSVWPPAIGALGAIVFAAILGIAAWRWDVAASRPRPNYGASYAGIGVKMVAVAAAAGIVLSSVAALQASQIWRPRSGSSEL